MANPFEDSYNYISERDGDLEDYLRIHNGITSFPLFKGIEIYKKLLEEGYLIENFSVIRLMWNIGREDEHFLVVENGKLEGITLNAHFGREGIYEPEEILKKVCFEAQNLKRNPKLDG